MVVLGLDTATRATAAAVLLDDGHAVQRRDDPPPGARPAHAARLLELAEAALDEAGIGWEAVDRLAVGVGPGGFTGLRIGLASARALAQARDLKLVGVGSLHALAAPVAAERADPVLAVLDARRGEAFAAAWHGDRPLLEPAALGPDALAAAVGGLGADVLAVGDGAVVFRSVLERAGAAVAPDDSAVHRLSAVAVCRLGAAAERPADRDALVPDYRRDPDAVARRAP